VGARKAKGGRMTGADMARLIDHTLLKADAKLDEIKRVCEEAVRYRFCAVCVNPFYVSRAKRFLEGSGVKIATVVGFPLGAGMTEVKVYEAMRCALAGADELDVVMNVGAARDGLWDVVTKDLSDVVAATPGLVHKAIIEACFLTDEEKGLAAKAALKAGMDFVKTSTGYGSGGATAHDVSLIKGVVGERAGIKAAGGIRSFAQALEMVEAGATRIGTSSGVSIVDGK